MADRRRAPILAIVAVVAVASVAVILINATGTRYRPERTPHVLAIPFSSAAPGANVPPVASLLPDSTCGATVDGTSAEAVKAAVASAGASIVCFGAGRFDEALTADVADQTWRLDPGTVLAGQVDVRGSGVRIVGGTVESDTADPWYESVRIYADDVTIEGVTFHGGGLPVAIHGVDRARIAANAFSDQLGTSIFVWGDHQGADDTIIEGNRIDQTRTVQASPISSRAADDPGEGVVNQRVTVRANTIDQGDDQTGWFGIELKLSPGSVVEGNRIRGGQVLVSLADSDDAVVRDNELDLTGSPHWGVEIASSDGVTVEANDFRGDGSDKDSAVSMNSGSSDATITDNMVAQVGTLVDLSGDGHRITGNCLDQVGHEYAYRSSGGGNIEFARNGACVAASTAPGASGGAAD